MAILGCARRGSCGIASQHLSRRRRGDMEMSDIDWMINWQRWMCAFQVWRADGLGDFGLCPRPTVDCTELQALAPIMSSWPEPSLVKSNATYSWIPSRLGSPSREESPVQGRDRGKSHSFVPYKEMLCNSAFGLLYSHALKTSVVPPLPFPPF